MLCSEPERRTEDWEERGVTGFSWDPVASGYKNQEVMRSRVLDTLTHTWWSHFLSFSRALLNMCSTLFMWVWGTSMEKDNSYTICYDHLLDVLLKITKTPHIIRSSYSIWDMTAFEWWICQKERGRLCGCRHAHTLIFFFFLSSSMEFNFWCWKFEKSRLKISEQCLCLETIPRPHCNPLLTKVLSLEFPKKRFPVRSVEQVEISITSSVSGWRPKSDDSSRHNNQNLRDQMKR